jgi:hypothetical protein
VRRHAGTGEQDNEMKARLQLQATQLEGPIEFLSDEQGRRATAANRGTLERLWKLRKKRALRPKRPRSWQTQA